LITPARGPIGINWSDWAKAGPVYGTGALLYASKSYTRLGFIFSKSSYVAQLVPALELSTLLCSWKQNSAL
jgi:hypothetical protein